MENNTRNNKIPQRIFIVPYRNRVEQKFFFTKHMSYILENDNSYEIYFSHQNDERIFNRGASKNIGFLAMKLKYPKHYKNITFIFNDVDTVPFYNIFDYNTLKGVVKHFYGFTHSLGGIISIKGSDFELINGFPNYWGWGMEDNCLQKRCNLYKINIDRSQFYPIGSPKILQFFDGMSRIISHQHISNIKIDNHHNGLKTISQLKFNINIISKNEADNIYVYNNKNIYYINIFNFITENDIKDIKFYNFDLRNRISDTTSTEHLLKTEAKIEKSEEWSDFKPITTKFDIKLRAANFVKNKIKERNALNIQK
jgi:hypothetical protein